MAQHKTARRTYKRESIKPARRGTSGSCRTRPALAIQPSSCTDAAAPRTVTSTWSRRAGPSRPRQMRHYG